MTSETLALDSARLEAWAHAHIDGFAGPLKASKFPTGQSNPTYLIETPARRYVMRRKPPGKLLKSAHMVEREYRVLRALDGAGFPAPRALALCEDESVIGSVFYLMNHVDGRIFWDPSLPDLTPDERGEIYDSMNAALARLHAVDVVAAGLGDYGKPGNYFARQLQRWGEQYRASETTVHADMDRLIEWLGAHVPADDGRVALVHGDWRIDNMIFAHADARLLAVLDWELSTLGHPYADLAYQCMQWRLPNAGESRGLAGLDRAALGIPSEVNYVAAYCRRTGIASIPDWAFLLAFSFFRVAAIVQGVYKRSLDGNASNPERARKMGEAVPLMARLAMEIVENGA
ncbi:phosphotransferase [Methylocapsa sp. S129]|uniref:phosphotransferase n=1 Tax=Methylocapsa sp. S129 TaxID=1641869 RepID=UPI00131CEF82|nr:phosphotransferase [Methylocapsa sp. S129]